MKFIICIILFGLLAVGCIISVRKKMPYDFRMINLNGNLIVHNKTIWNHRDFTLRYQTANHKQTITLNGGTNTAVITGVKAGDLAICKIVRQDIVGKLRYKPFRSDMKIPEKVNRYVVVVGASIGMDWNLELLPQRRQDLKETAILYWPEYRFDKKVILDHIMKIPIKPDILILKECAAYFPRNERDSVETIKKWSAMLQDHGIKPVIMTTLPVTQDNDAAHTGRAHSINTFNELLRRSGLSYIDAASGLADVEAPPYIARQYAQKDGLHLNELAYRKLDTILAEVMR